jgi:hypothetical protein
MKYKNNKSPDPEIDLSDDPLLDTLKKKFFSLLKEERFPKTPEITEELDFIQETIRELVRESNEYRAQKISE